MNYHAKSQLSVETKPLLCTLTAIATPDRAGSHAKNDTVLKQPVEMNPTGETVEGHPFYGCLGIGYAWYKHHREENTTEAVTMDVIMKSHTRNKRTFVLLVFFSWEM